MVGWCKASFRTSRKSNIAAVLSTLHMLLGGFHPSEKYARQIGWSPYIGTKTKYIWNHHLVWCTSFPLRFLLVMNESICRKILFQHGGFQCWSVHSTLCFLDFTCFRIVFVLLQKVPWTYNSKFAPEKRRPKRPQKMELNLPTKSIFRYKLFLLVSGRVNKNPIMKQHLWSQSVPSFLLKNPAWLMGISIMRDHQYSEVKKK